ncbi:glycoside hydrolase family 3 C-terminal domain-containing protein [Sorangium sp. So ce134]
MLPFQDPGLPIEVRVHDLLGRLTLDEKISLLHQFQPAIPRLGIPDFKAGTEALHGVAWSTDRDNGGAVVTATGTVFPQAIGLATTWNPDLIRQVGEAVGDEVRGYHALAPRVWGLQVWAPVVNLLRDPRWGRNEEGYSEDPLLSGAMATAYGRGLQGDDPLYLKTAPVLKHFLANNNEIRRDTTSSSLRPRVRHEYDELAFKMPIAADAVTGVMTSYNLVNGRPCTVNPDVADVVRSWTQKTLYNVSDAWAPYNLTGSQQYFATNEEAFAATLLAGVDSFTVDNNNSAPTIEILHSALEQGLLTEEDIDASVEHVLSVRLRLGDFDPEGGPYAGIGPEVIDSPAHRQLARQAADEAMVLLENKDRLLPLDPSATRRIAVVGPLSDTLYTDWYSGALPYRVTPLDGIRERLGDADVLSSEGVDRIALRDVASGRYVTAGADEDGDILRISAASAGPTEQFDMFDWGQGIVTLRSAANGKVVDRFNSGANFANRAAQPYDWFVQQQFVLEPQSDGTHVIRYAGYEKAFDWAGPEVYLTIAEDGALALTATEAADAARFEVEVIRSGVDEAVSAVTGADAAVVVVGSMPFINGREDHDRTTMALAEGQSALVQAVLAANPRTIVVLETSYPMTIPWEKSHVPAILWTTHAGQETGHAISDVLFGDHNPAGRLTQTWYRSEDDMPDILEYDIIKARRTYLYFEGDPLYPFGYGLSYSTFRYDNLRRSIRPTQAGDRIAVRVDVTNTSERAGEEVVQLYSRQLSSRDLQPVRQLRAFERIHLAPGEKRTVQLDVAASDLAHWDVTRSRWVLEASGHELMVGSSSADIRQRTTVRVGGEHIPARRLNRETRAIDFDDYAGVELVNESVERGDAVGAAAGDWLRFSDVGLGFDASRFSGAFARVEAGDALVEIRLDDPVDGELVGTAVVPSTGDVFAYATVTAELDGARGRRDVYLVFRGAARLSTFTIE